MQTNRKKEIILDVKGMDCATCATKLENGVCQLQGVESSHTNFATEKIRVVGSANPDEIIQQIRKLGYDAVVPESDNPIDQMTETSNNFFAFLWNKTEGKMALLGAFLIIPGLILEEILQQQHIILDFLAIMAILSAGYPIFRSAYTSLMNKDISINLLMAIAATGAVIIGAYTEAGMTMVLFSFGESLENFTTQRARRAIKRLMEVAPQKAHLLQTANTVKSNPESSYTDVHVNELAPNDIILVRPGERIPMDGIIISGESHINQAPITGESQLIQTKPNTPVYASSINGEGVLEIKVTNKASDNTISRMIRLVSEAEEKRSHSQRFIDRFARYYTPIIIILAMLVMVIPPLFFGQTFNSAENLSDGWFYRGLALLVVGCPCALVISTPVSIISAISNAAQQGVLFKGGINLEELSRIKAIAFDKTGTLTAGTPGVINIRTRKPESAESSGNQIALSGYTDDEINQLVTLASAVEVNSEHPLAYAIVKEAESRGLKNTLPKAQNVQAHAGKGVSGTVDGTEIFIGSHKHFDEYIPHHLEDCTEANNQTESGYTPIMISLDRKYLGTITLADQVRSTSKEAIGQLKKLGLTNLIMLTGDNPKTARKLGEIVGITDILADLLPEQKVEAVENLKTKFQSIAMVGDGINDTPALATANVGIALGNSIGGSSQAMETADITLMRDDLRLLPFAIKLSRATMRTIKFNIILSLSIKFFFFLLVLTGFGTMWMAVLSDTVTTLIVTLIGMRLLKSPTYRQ